jgi:hypothetical protein
MKVCDHVVPVGAVGKWNRSCDFQGHFLPVFSIAFGSPIRSLFLLLSFLFPHGVSAHLDAMGVVHQAVEDSVGQLKTF